MDIGGSQALLKWGMHTSALAARRLKPPSRWADPAREAMAPQRRRDERRKRRLTCQLRHGSEALRGIVLDVSRGGLFVQTSTPVPSGTEVIVAFPPRAEGPAFELRARVVRRRRVPQRLASLAPSGLGLQVLEAPDAYHDLVERREDRSHAAGDPAAPVAPTIPLQKYRVRVTQRGSPRSRTLVLEAEHEQEARSRIAREMGADWDLVEIEAC